MNDPPFADEQGFEDIVLGRDTPEARAVITQVPSFALLRYALLLRGAPRSVCNFASSRSDTAKPVADLSLLELIPSLLSRAVGAAEEAIADFLRPAARWLEPAVLGAGEPMDFDRPGGILISKVSLQAPALQWSARSESLRGKQVALRQLDRGPHLLGAASGTNPVIRFDHERNLWLVDPTSIGSPAQFRDRWFVIAAELEGNVGAATECVILRFEDGVHRVRSGPEAFAAVRNSYFAEAVQWFASSDELPAVKAAFVASAVGAQAYLFRLNKDRIQDEVSSVDRHLFKPTSLFTESITHLVQDAHALILRELKRGQNL